MTLSGRAARGRWQLDDLGDQLLFYVRALAWTPRTLRRYKREVLRLLAEVTFGSGALAVIGGTVGVIAFLSFFTGTEVGLQGYAALDQIGTSAFTGFLSAYFNTREIAPLVAGPGAVGDGRLRLHRAARRDADHRGDRRPRGDGRAVAAVPGDHPDDRRLHRRHPAVRVGLLTSYFATRTIATQAYGQSAGTYDHYFHLFLPPVDVLWSFGKVLVFAVVIILTHCYYGYRATGGPAGVGVAVGRAVRFSIVAVNIIDFFLSLAIWGSTTTVRIAG